MKLASIVIPTYNRKEKLVRLLHSINDSNIKDLEIIVVDDHSTDGTDDIINDFPYIKYLKHEKETLVAKSLNDGITMATTDLVMIIDDDNVVVNDTISKLVDYMNNHPDVGVAGPVSCYLSIPDTVMYAGGIYTKFSRRTIFLHRNSSVSNLIGQSIEADGIANSFMLRKSLALEVGLIPFRRVPWNGEDGYLIYKIKKLGKKVVVLGDSKIYHDVDPNQKNRYNSFRLYYAIRSKIIFHLDLDDAMHKFSFIISLPGYLFSYLITTQGTGIPFAKRIYWMIVGMIDGFKRVEVIKIPKDD